LLAKSKGKKILSLRRGEVRETTIKVQRGRWNHGIAGVGFSA